MAGEILDAVEREYEKTREKNAAIANRNRLTALKIEGYKEIEDRLKELAPAIARAEFFDEDAVTAETLKKERSELEKKRAALLKKAGLNVSDLQTKFNCVYCKDTGYVKGLPCRCFNEKWKKYTFAELGIQPMTELTFENDTAPKSFALSKLYCKMREFTQMFPNTKTKNFLFTGTTGCGKTYLASIVAGELSKKGYNAVLITSMALNRLFFKMHTSRPSERPDYMGILTDCDLLVIDDLGAENLYTNVTGEYLYALISERHSYGKHTIITTNLTTNELIIRYGDRFFSRITEKGISSVVSFDETNMRAQK